MEAKKRIFELALAMEEELLKDPKSHNKHTDILMSNVEKISTFMLLHNEELLSDNDDFQKILTMAERMDELIEKESFLISSVKGAKTSRVLKKAEVEIVAMSEKVRETLLIVLQIDPNNIEKHIDDKKVKKQEPIAQKVITNKKETVKRYTISKDVKTGMFFGFLSLSMPLIIGVLVMGILLGGGFIDILSGKLIFVSWLLGYEIMSLFFGVSFMEKILFERNKKNTKYQR